MVNKNLIVTAMYYIKTCEPPFTATGIATTTFLLAIMKNNLCGVMCGATGKESLYMVGEKLTYHTAALKRHSVIEITSNINRTMLRVLQSVPCHHSIVCIIRLWTEEFFKS
jgi:hypothetical protein